MRFIDRIKIPTKVLGWTMVAVGLLILADPIFTSQFGWDFVPSTVGMITGITLQMVGLTIITGIPSVNKIWNEIEYGVYAIIFITGLALIYIQMNTISEFWSLLLKYTVFGVVTGVVSVVLNAWLSTE